MRGSILAFSTAALLATAASAGPQLTPEAKARVEQGFSACIDYMETGKSVKSLKQLGFKGFLGGLVVWANNPDALGKTQIGVNTEKGRCSTSASAWRQNSARDAFKLAGKALEKRGFKSKQRKVDDRKTEIYYQKKVELMR